MKRLPPLALLVLLGCSVPPQAVPVRRAIPPQAVPVGNWAEACTTSDVELLKTVFSSRMRTVFAKAGWEETLKTYVKLFAEDFGDYDLADFEYGYEGDDAHGEVLVSFQGKRHGRLRVIKEDGAGKIDER